MKKIVLLLFLCILAGCKKDDPVYPDMTTFLVGTYVMDYGNNMGDRTKYVWVIKKESDNTVGVHLTRTDTPYMKTAFVASKDSVSGVKVESTHKLQFSFQKNKDNVVDVEGTLYKGILFVKSEYYRMEAGFQEGLILNKQ